MHMSIRLGPFAFLALLLLLTTGSVRALNKVADQQPTHLSPHQAGMGTQLLQQHLTLPRHKQSAHSSEHGMKATTVSTHSPAGSLSSALVKLPALQVPRHTVNSPAFSAHAFNPAFNGSAGYALLNWAGNASSGKGFSGQGYMGPYTAQHAPTSVLLKSGITNDKSIDITVGKARVINLPYNVARVSMSDPNTAQVLVISPTQLQIVGKQPGLTNMTLWNSPYDASPMSYDVCVSRDVSQLAKQLQKIDTNIHITAMAADNSVILTGEVDNPEVAQVAMQVARVYFQNSGGGAATRVATASQQGGNASGGNTAGVNSQSPGSSITTASLPNVVNLLKVKGRPSSKMALVAGKLKAIDPHIEMDVVSGADGKEKVMLSGKVSSASVVSQAINTASIFYGEPGIKVLTGPGGNAIRSTTTGQFQDNNNFSNNLETNILQGSVVTDASGNVVSMMQVVNKPQIRCRIKILDISRKDLNQLGATFSAANRNLAGASLNGAQSALRNFVDINGEGSGAAFSGSRGSGGVSNAGLGGLNQTFRQGVTQVLTLNQSFTAALTAFIEKRNIKSLAEPTLTMLSGEKASFLAGGEIPVPVSGSQGQINVSFKEFGIRLNIIPTLTAEGRIHLQVAPEVSEVDPVNSIIASNITIPGFKTRRMQTTLELDNNQSFMMAGLFNHTTVDTMSKLPGMGNIPLLGAFFRQKNGEKSDNEMVVIIQPEIVTPTESAQGLK
jgi:Flp pilus assembly secretin CpaC